MYHEELESLVKNFPTIKRARFWMTFRTRISYSPESSAECRDDTHRPVLYNGVEVRLPIQFLKAVLPDPGRTGENYSGETSIGCRIRGIKEGKEQTYMYGITVAIRQLTRKQGRKALATPQGFQPRQGH